MLQTLAYIAQILGGVGIFVAAITYLVHQRQLSFEVIASCMERFQNIMADLESGYKPREHLAKKRYVDLCNEQLFYCRNGYLHEEVVEEWLDGMLNFLPLKYMNGEVHPRFSGKIEEEYLKDYPGIERAFTVSRRDDATSPRDQRKNLVQQVRENVNPRRGLFDLVRRSFR